uniref:Uncharacterized protein n=1 Tax=Cannabis sativa TaxID=3483 RepID=A0A803QRQ7_CANSA
MSGFWDKKKAICDHWWPLKPYNTIMALWAGLEEARRKGADPLGLLTEADLCSQSSSTREKRPWIRCRLGSELEDGGKYEVAKPFGATGWLILHLSTGLENPSKGLHLDISQEELLVHSCVLAVELTTPLIPRSKCKIDVWADASSIRRNPRLGHGPRAGALQCPRQHPPEVSLSLGLLEEAPPRHPLRSMVLGRGRTKKVCPGRSGRRTQDMDPTKLFEDGIHGNFCSNEKQAEVTEKPGGPYMARSRTLGN